MSKTGPIILIDDDIDDQEIFREAILAIEQANELLCFSTTEEAFEFLKKMDGQPFLIFCDVNLPKQSGMQFKKQVDDDPELRKKSIPFLFHSTSVDKRIVTEAYTELCIQGFFVKQFNYEDIISSLKIIFEYWNGCEHPSDFFDMTGV